MQIVRRETLAEGELSVAQANDFGFNGPIKISGCQKCGGFRFTAEYFIDEHGSQGGRIFCTDCSERATGVSGPGGERDV